MWVGGEYFSSVGCRLRNLSGHELVYAHTHTHIHSLQKQCSSGKGMESTGTVFIDSVCRLIALLLDYRKISNDECHKNRRMGCMLNLLVSQPTPCLTEIGGL